jgi:mono/diheme cytochrome c family protein
VGADDRGRPAHRTGAVAAANRNGTVTRMAEQAPSHAGGGRRHGPFLRRPAPPERRAPTRQNLIALLIAGAFVALLPFAWYGGQPKPAAAPSAGIAVPPGNAAAARGRKVYDAYCAYCHGIDLDGRSSWFAPTTRDAVTSPRLDAGGRAARLSDRTLFGITKYGGTWFATPGVESKMPAFDRIIDDDAIRDAIAYIKLSWTPADGNGG